MNALLNGIHCEKNPLIASALTNYLSSPLQETSSVERDKIENELYRLSYSHPIPSCRIQLLRLLINVSSK